jgi:hypothetical protein
MVGSIVLASEVSLLLLVPTSTAPIQIKCAKNIVRYQGVPPDACVLSLTNSGYDFLEASKQPSLWERAKAQLISNGIPLTVATIKTVLQTLINDALAKLH